MQNLDHKSTKTVHAFAERTTTIPSMKTASTTATTASTTTTTTHPGTVISK